MGRTFLNQNEKLDYRVESHYKRNKHCWKCNAMLSKEDEKFGCQRCEWRKHGHDVPNFHPVQQRWTTIKGKRIRIQ